VNIYTKSRMKKETKQYIRQLGEASTIGLQVGLSVFIGLGIGVWLDSKFGTFPWLALLFLVLGVASGFLNYYRFIKRQKDEEK
jgi:ATP synthase protein I